MKWLDDRCQIPSSVSYSSHPGHAERKYPVTLSIRLPLLLVRSVGIFVEALDKRDIRIEDRDPNRRLKWLCAKLAAAWIGKRDAVPVGLIPGSRMPSPDSRPCMSMRVGSQDADRLPRWQWLVKVWPVAGMNDGHKDFAFWPGRPTLAGPRKGRRTALQWAKPPPSTQGASAGAAIGLRCWGIWHYLVQFLAPALTPATVITRPLEIRDSRVADPPGRARRGSEGWSPDC
ncbi:hypothetical protein VTN96DRAFT_8758 [Rasamsonia emersonii]